MARRSLEEHAKGFGFALGGMNQARSILMVVVFAGTVGAEESEDFALLDGEREVSNGANTFAKEADAKLFAEVFEFDDGAR